MKKLAVIYHSPHGHTEHIARRIAEGAAAVPATDVHVLEADHLANSPEDLIGFDGYIFGSPTYLGGVCGPFKSFMDATGRLWRSQRLKGKFACGFTVSSLPAGDKQSTLLSMFVFAMQHEKTARMFGRNFAQALHRMDSAARAAEQLEAAR